MKKKIAIAAVAGFVVLAGVLVVGSMLLLNGLAEFALDAPQFTECLETTLGIEVGEGGVWEQRDTPQLQAHLERLENDPALRVQFESCLEAGLSS